MYVCMYVCMYGTDGEVNVSVALQSVFTGVTTSYVTFTCVTTLREK